MTLSADWARDVLNFWFVELGRPRWFAPDVALDRHMRDRFLAEHEALRASLPFEATENADACLAAILALDQFPRNMFRGTARMFASDGAALALARCAVDKRFDAALAAERRVFVYMPFEHSEDPVDQVESVRLISALGDAEYSRYAIAHKAVIDRFGRFPHRNAILGWPSTAEEVAFLTEPGSSF